MYIERELGQNSLEVACDGDRDAPDWEPAALRFLDTFEGVVDMFPDDLDLADIDCRSLALFEAPETGNNHHMESMQEIINFEHNPGHKSLLIFKLKNLTRYLTRKSCEILPRIVPRILQNLRGLANSIVPGSLWG